MPGSRNKLRRGNETFGQKRGICSQTGTLAQLHLSWGLGFALLPPPKALFPAFLPLLSPHQSPSGSCPRLHMEAQTSSPTRQTSRLASLAPSSSHPTFLLPLLPGFCRVTCIHISSAAITTPLVVEGLAVTATPLNRSVSITMTPRCRSNPPSDEQATGQHFQWPNPASLPNGVPFLPWRPSCPLLTFSRLPGSSFSVSWLDPPLLDTTWWGTGPPSSVLGVLPTLPFPSVHCPLCPSPGALNHVWWPQIPIS